MNKEWEAQAVQILPESWNQGDFIDYKCCTKSFVRYTLPCCKWQIKGCGIKMMFYLIICPRIQNCKDVQDVWDVFLKSDTRLYFWHCTITAKKRGFLLKKGQYKNLENVTLLDTHHHINDLIYYRPILHIKIQYWGS